MKKYDVRTRFPRKLTIDKARLRIVSSDELAGVNGGGDPAQGVSHKGPDGFTY